MGNICSISISLDAIFSNCKDFTCARAAYISELKENLLVLQTELQKLSEARDDVMMRVISSEQQQMKRLNQVQGWLSRVQAVEIEVDALIEDSSQEIDKLCLAGYCSKNFKSSYKFGKKVVKKLVVVAALKAEGTFEVVAQRVLIPTAVDERPSEPTVGLESTFHEVWRCLEEKQVGIIGLYGMGGVGKTTLLTQINNKFIESPKGFDVVIWVVVSRELQLEKIQESIAKKLGIFDELWRHKSLEDKALEIFRILSKKNFVLLLDDIWERIDLTKVGIPLPSAKVKSKIIFTTRFVEVCGLMEAHMKLRVECLAHEKAWKLFQNKVGEETLNSHPDIPELAATVTKECGRLPLALITIGRAMACKKTPQEWRYAIQVLRRSAFEFPGMGKEVYPLLKFSYDSLSSDAIRSCFLYCSLFPEDYSISKRHLIDCWIGEGLLIDDEKSGVQNQGYYIIGTLLHACLLEEEGDDSVKMHDVLRDMALWIACEIQKESENFLVHAGVGLTEMPNFEKWKGVRRKSLMENQIHGLSKIPTCPLLITLFVNNNSLETINDCFFQSMSSLRVLNLSYNDSLRDLPSGISTLVSLQYLDLSETSIKELPIELRALVNIKCLNLENTNYLHKIPQQLISSFSMLHVLRIFNCGFVYQKEDSVLFGDSELLVEELLGLEHLNMLSISLKSLNALQRSLRSAKLQNCIQCLCLLYLENSKPINFLSLADMKSLDTLNIWNCKYLEELKMDYANEVQKMIWKHHGFHSLHTVHIDYCLKLRDLTWLVLAPNLKTIKISSCTRMEEIISVERLEEVPEMMGNINPFAKLQSLKLQHLHNLKSIYRDALPFPCLKEMIVYECPMLKKLPLDSNSVKERKFVIEGEKHWWDNLQWEDQATQNSFRLCFISR